MKHAVVLVHLFDAWLVKYSVHEHIEITAKPRRTYADEPVTVTTHAGDENL